MVRVRVAEGLGWGKLGLVNGLVMYCRDGVRVRVWCRRELYESDKITWLLRAATAAAGIVAEGRGWLGWLGLR